MADAEIARRSGGPRLLGIQVRVQPSWLIIALLLAWSLAAGSFPQIYEGLPRASYWTMAVVVVVGLAVSLILHEMAHSLVGRAFGLSVDRITLFMFGGVAELRQEPTAPRAELLMALAGPALSLVLAVGFGALATAAKDTGPEIVGSLSYLATLNLVLAVFNLVPAFPMDGGRVLRALLWMAMRDADRATRIAARVGEGMALLLILAGVGLALTGQVVGGIWWALIGMFLRTAAKASAFDLHARRLLKGYPVGELMDDTLEILSADMTVDDYVARRLYAGQHGMYPVAKGGTTIGVVEAENVLKTPRDHWSKATLSEVCTPLDCVSTARSIDDAHAVLDRMTLESRSRLLVLDHDRVVGVITLRDLLERLELAAQFERGARRRSES